MSDRAPIRGPLDATVVPRFAGPTTFARLPRQDEVDRWDVAIVGVPFDAGVTYRPGARFGPQAVRQGSRLLRPYHAPLDAEPLTSQQVVDAGDLVANPFSIAEAVQQIEAGATALLERSRHLVTIGGDHTIALPLLRAVTKRDGPVAVLHFDAHLDTWDTYFGAAITHGTPFRRASEEGLLAAHRSVHVGIRGPLFGREDLSEDRNLGFHVVETMEVADRGAAAVAAEIRERVGDTPLYVSVDIDVIDPGMAPGTGTPEAGGLLSRELLLLLRNLAGLHIVAADVVEVAPAYDHAETTAIAAAHVVYELLALFTKDPAPRAVDG
ncbi:MAG: agmatinase [Candidatus Dormiibacterota bacterium]